MNVIESRKISASYQRVASQQDISEIEKVLKVDAVQTSVSSLATGLPSLLSLMGLGKEIWKDVDAQTYVKKIRDEWQD